MLTDGLRGRVSPCIFSGGLKAVNFSITGGLGGAGAGSTSVMVVSATVTECGV